MARLSDQELQQFLATATADGTLAVSPRAPVAAPSELGGPSFPAGEQPELADVGRMVGNAPGDLLNVAKDTGMAVANAFGGRDPNATLGVGRGGTIETLLRLIAGTGQEAGRRLLGTEDTQNAQLARGAAQQVLEMLRNPRKTVVNEPVSSMLMLSGLAPALRAGAAAQAASDVTVDASKLGRLGQIMLENAPSLEQAAAGAEALNPLRAMAVSAGKLGAGTAKGAEWLGRQMTALGTNASPASLERAVQAGEASAARRAGFLQTLRGNVTGEELATSVKGYFGELEDAASKEVARALPTVKYVDPADPVSLVDLRKKSFEAMDHYNLQPVFTKSGEVSKVLNAQENPTQLNVEDVLTGIQAQHPDLQKLGKALASPQELDRIQEVATAIQNWTDNTPQGLHILKRYIDARYDRSGEMQISNGYVATVRKYLRDELGDKTDTYNDIMAKFEHIANILDEWKNTFNIQGKNPESWINKLTGLLKDARNSPVRQRLAKDLESASGLPILDQIAGLELSPAIPSGVFGRSKAAGITALSGGVGGIAGGLMSLPFLSPRAMGEFMSVLGVGKRGINRVVTNMQRLHQAIPPGMATEGLTLGAIIQQLRDHQPEQLTQP